MAINSLQVRDLMLDYLTTPGFSFFEPSNVIDYDARGEIWVRATVSAGCAVRLLYNYATGRNTIEFVYDTDPATTAFYDQLETIASFWGLTVANNTTSE